MSKEAEADGAEVLIARTDTVGNASTTEANGSNSGNSQSSGNNTNSWGPSPSTAVAMIM